jgi:hypothetical protein
MIDKKMIRSRIEELERVAGCDLSNADLDRLEGWFWDGYKTAMPAWAFHQIGNDTAEKRSYKLGQMTRRIQLQRTLCVGRSRVQKK